MRLRAAAILFAAVASPTLAESIYLVDGKPVQNRMNMALVSFDGANRILVRADGHSFTLNARTPAQVSVSPSGRYLVHSFGDGSGQVLDISVHALPRGKSVNVSDFKRRVLAFARARKTCTAEADQISYRVERWLGPSSVRIGTEDWTRRPGCSHLFRKWTLKLR